MLKGLKSTPHNKCVKISDQYTSDADAILYAGDGLDLLSSIPSGSVKLIVSSPPYNLGKIYERNQKMSLDQWVNWQRLIIQESIRVMHPSGSICWQVGHYVKDGIVTPLDCVLYPVFQELGLVMRNRIVWTFNHGLHCQNRFSGRHETIMWWTRPGKDYTFNLDAVRVPQLYPNKKHFKGPKKGQLSGNLLGKSPGDVWSIPNVKANHVEKTTHPCQFPVQLVERLILALTNPGDLVVDPFIGSGSTAVASLMHGRRCAGADIHDEYIQIARNRLELLDRGELKVRSI